MEEVAIDDIRKQVSVASYFGVTFDDYINKFYDNYNDLFISMLLKFNKEITKEFPQLTKEDQADYIVKIYTQFEEVLDNQFDRLQTFLVLSKFTIQQNVILPDDEEINKVKDEFLASNNHKDVTKIKELQQKIKQKQIYAKLLMQKIAFLLKLEKSFDTISKVTESLDNF